MESLAPLFNLYVFTPGRVIFAATQVKRAAKSRKAKDADEKRDLKLIETACDRAVAAGQEALEASNAWQRAKAEPTARAGGSATALDPLLDRAVSGVSDGAANFTRSLSREHPLSLKAGEFLRAAFPAGVSAITSLPYEDELAAVNSLLARLQDPKDLAPVAKQLSLEPFVTELAQVTDKFATALRAPSAVQATYGLVKSTQAAAQERLLQLAARIAGTFNEQTAAHIEARTDLLGPIVSQNERISDAYRRHRPVVDVNPGTGEETTQPVDPTTKPTS